MGSRGLRWEYSYTVLLITWLGWISIYLARSVLPPVLPILAEELGFTYTQSGLLETAYLIGYIVIKMPAGALSNRFGARKVLAVSMVGYGAATFLVSGAKGFADIFVLRLLVGLFQGVHLPVANALLSDRFGHRQSRAIGFNESGANIGNTLAFPITVTIASSLGWRYAFMFLSLPAFLLSVATFALMKEEKPAPSEADVKPNGRLRDYTWVLAPFALSHGVYNLVLRVTYAFTPSFLVEFKGMDVATAGLVATILPLAGIFAKLASGLVVERLGRRLSICGASALSAVFLATLVLFPSGAYLGVNLVLLGLTLYSFSPIIYSSTTQSLPSEYKSLGLGAVTMFGNMVGAVSTSVVGALIDLRGFSFTFLAISAATILSSALIAAVMRGEDGSG
ncbi:MAG: MFS transporter [Candidatus Bathyarchaeota archaeon]